MWRTGHLKDISPIFFTKFWKKRWLLMSHERVYANSLRALLAEGNINNLRKKVYISQKSIKDEFKHFKNYVYIPIFQMGQLSDAWGYDLSWIKKFPRKDEHQTVAMSGYRFSATHNPDVTLTPTPGSGWQEQDVFIRASLFCHSGPSTRAR